ncbi:hypothetical protein Nepgr_026726 [Nepenthes gracilis]|uniref:Uncharacterized protein n=1 Tax=Nepenthes gracilis TaxID=150966 RepID=A0AAD3Y0U3_NEPGR|nr:hypothetical protein Nepgr_026726 [Nepenthes gracilis]
MPVWTSTNGCMTMCMDFNKWLHDYVRSEHHQWACFNNTTKILGNARSCFCKLSMSSRLAICMLVMLRPKNLSSTKAKEMRTQKKVIICLTESLGSLEMVMACSLLGWGFGLLLSTVLLVLFMEIDLLCLALLGA